MDDEKKHLELLPIKFDTLTIHVGKYMRSWIRCKIQNMVE